jgi:hypothetical protein
MKFVEKNEKKNALDDLFQCLATTVNIKKNAIKYFASSKRK